MDDTTYMELKKNLDCIKAVGFSSRVADTVFDMGYSSLKKARASRDKGDSQDERFYLRMSRTFVDRAVDFNAAVHKQEYPDTLEALCTFCKFRNQTR